MENIITCPHCNGTAKLVTGTMTLKKGLVKIAVDESHYECTKCGRKIHTHEQDMSIAEQVTQKRGILPLKIDPPKRKR